MSNGNDKSTRAAIARLRGDYPTYRDVLRQKYQRQLEKGRRRRLDERRGISKENSTVVKSLSQILREDILLMLDGKEPHVLDEPESELEDDESKWLMHECDKILDDEQWLDNILDDLDKVICPICQKSSLNLDNFVVTCVCGVSLNTQLNMLQIKENILKCVDLHNNACGSDPGFMIANEDGNHIYLICYDCSSFEMLL